MQRYTVETYAFSDLEERAGDHDRTYFLLLLIEGSWPRGALLSILQQPSRKGLPIDLPEGHRQVALECLESVRAPLRWADSLATFLHNRTIPLVGHYAMLRQVEEYGDRSVVAVRDGSYAGDVWDFCTGRVVQVSELLPRRTAYAGAVANSGDLDLQTRLAEVYVSTPGGPKDELEQLVDLLSFLHRNRLVLLSLRTVGTSFEVEYELTLAQWIAMHGARGETPSETAELARSLITSLNLRDDVEAVADRLAELRRDSLTRTGE